jgi:hypothetical protein
MIDGLAVRLLITELKQAILRRASEILADSEMSHPLTL